MKNHLCWLIGAVIVLFGSMAAGQDVELPGFAGPDVDDGVRVSLTAARAKVAAGGAAPVGVRVNIEKGYHTYRKTLTVTPGEDWPEGFGLKLGDYPEPKRKFDSAFQQEMEIYEAPSVTLVGTITAGEGVAPGEYTLPIKVGLQSCLEDRCFMPRTVTLSMQVEVLPVGTVVPGAEPAEPEEDETRAAPAEDQLGERSWLNMLLVAFVSGLALWLTPCVYPITPVTVAVIGASESTSRIAAFLRSVVYVLGIAVVYAVLGVIAGMTGGLFGAWSAHPVVNGVLAGLFVLFALAMFDFYALQLPAGTASRLEQRLRGKGGIIGVFVMGMVSATVLSPCITPVIGGLLVYVANTGNVAFGFLTFFVLALGMGVPIIILGTFTGLLKSMPKSGAWMITVKHLFGVLMLGVAVWFLHRAGVPPVWLMGIIAVLLTIFSVTAGALEPLPEDATANDRVVKVFGRLSFFVAFALVLRLLLPVAGAGPGVAVPEGQGGYTELPSRELSGPAIGWTPWSEEAVEEALAAGKPVMIDFTADWCSSCQVMERTTFRDPDVVEESKRFAAFKVDMSHEYLNTPRVKRARELYGVMGAPNIIFYNSEGQRLPGKRIQKETGAEEFLETLKSVE